MDEANKLSIRLKETYVVLIGASVYTDDPALTQLASVKNNVSGLAKILTDESIIGIPKENITTLLDEESTDVVLRGITKACKDATDALIVYYAGHGILSKEQNRLYLALMHSREESAEADALEFDKIKKFVRDSNAKNKLIILDNCFSGNAITELDSMASLESTVRARINEERGSINMLTATLANREAIAPEGSLYTLFTDVLIKILGEGVDTGDWGITIRDLYRHAKLDIVKRNSELTTRLYPEPDFLPDKNADVTIIARNKRYTSALEPKNSLTGILEVLHYSHKILTNMFISRTAQLWFVGFTGAFGPAHNNDHIRIKWQSKYPGNIGFDTYSREFNDALTALLSSIRGPIYSVMLKRDQIMEKFLKPLYRHDEYSDYDDDTFLNARLAEINKFQDRVEKALEVRSRRNHAYVEELPKQCIVVRYFNAGEEQFIGLEIKVGTENIGTDPVKAYYFEGEACKDLIMYAENLYATR